MSNLFPNLWIGVHVTYGPLVALRSDYFGCGPIKLYFLADGSFGVFERSVVVPGLRAASAGEAQELIPKMMEQKDGLRAAFPGLVDQAAVSARPRRGPVVVAVDANSRSNPPSRASGPTASSQVEAPSEIRREAEARGITRLCHFTRIENVPNIIRAGLLTRAQLKKSGTPFEFNDTQRRDGHCDAVCLSIQHPNWKMLSRLKFQNAGHVWAVIGIKPEILWQADCAFFPENAASWRASNTWIELAKGAKALVGLYSDVAHDADGRRVDRRALGIPRSCPTNPQAEVLVFGAISPAQFQFVAVEGPAGLRTLDNVSCERRAGLEYRVDNGLYWPRSAGDREAWKKRGRESPELSD